MFIYISKVGESFISNLLYISLMANANYVSVTAGKDAEEANAVLSEFQKAGYSLNGNYVPALGLQVSEKTLNGINRTN